MDAELPKDRAWFCDGHHKNAESAKDIADPGCLPNRDASEYSIRIGFRPILNR
jgi:hypothetical protein